MIHTRRWYVSPAENAETLAEKLTQHSWTLCTGFALQGTLFLNDSTSEDGAQEYAVLRRPLGTAQPWLQVESITFGWCNRQEALEFIRKAIQGTWDATGRPVKPIIESATEHGRCGLCA